MADQSVTFLRELLVDGRQLCISALSPPYHNYFLLEPFEMKIFKRSVKDYCTYAHAVEKITIAYILFVLVKNYTNENCTTDNVYNILTLFLNHNC